MKADQLFGSIESGSVHAELGLASTTRTLLLFLKENKIVQSARRQLDPEDITLLLERALSLYERPGPPGYAHPSDLALCAYLYLLADTAHVEAQKLIERIASEGRREFAAASAVARYFTRLGSSTTLAHVNKNPEVFVFAGRAAEWAATTPRVSPMPEGNVLSENPALLCVASTRQASAGRAATVQTHA
ncbi:MAG: hypothetical protein HY320_11845 [Armatimonadetes bacterium]|nr:hypothetical protein [Armatimonadota bacterium]